MISWGDFESMSVHYLRELAKRSEEGVLFFCDNVKEIYGVSGPDEFIGIVKESEEKVYRLVCGASTDEFMGLLLARFMDFTEEEADADKKKGISTRELFGSEPAALDAGGDRGEKGGRSEDIGSQKEEDNNRKIH